MEKTKKIVVIIALVVVVGVVASTIGAAFDLYSIFETRSNKRADVFPQARELALNLDFESGTYGVREVHSATHSIVQLTGNKVMKVYNAENSTAGDWSHFNMRADDIDEKYQTVKYGETVFASSKLYVSMDVVKTSETVYDGVKLEFKGASGMPYERCWMIASGGSIFAQDDTKLGELRKDVWTNIGIVIDMAALTMDYYVDNVHVHTLTFDYATDVVKYFNMAAPVFATTQSLYVDNIKLFFEER